MKKVKEKEAPDLSSLLVFGYACKLFRCYYNKTFTCINCCAFWQVSAKLSCDCAV